MENYHHPQKTEQVVSDDVPKGAEDDLAKRFTSFKISKTHENKALQDYRRHNQRSVHTVKVSTMWSFAKENYISSDVDVKQHIFRLQQIGHEVNTTNCNKGWIKKLYEGANNLKELQAQSPTKSKVSFGKLCFKPISSRFPVSTIPLNDLQELQRQDFDMRWTNICARTPSFQTTLLHELEEKVDNDTLSYSTMLVYLVDFTNKPRKEYELKYHLVDKQWKLHNGYARRIVRSKFDVFVNNDTSFRLRSATREKLSENIVKCLERLVVLSIPSNGNFFDTKATLRRTAPRGLSLKWAASKLKFSMERNGLWFTIAYLDTRRDEFRLECRLLREEQTQLNVNKRSVLLKKMLELLHVDNI